MNETEFKAKVSNNPVNVRNCSTMCSEPQPRYKMNPYGLRANPSQRSILFYQCFPGCKANTTTTTMTTNMMSGTSRDINIATDKACAPYAINQHTKLAKNNVKTTNPQSLKTEDTYDTGNITCLSTV